MARVALLSETEGARMSGIAGPEARRALMHRPAMADAVGNLNAACMDSLLPPRLNELVRYRIALVNGCTRCQAFRAPAAVAAGVTDADLFAVADWRASSDYSDVERAAIDYTERFLYDPSSIDDTLVDTLRSELGDDGVVDLTVSIAKYMAIGRLIAVLDLDQDVSLGPPQLV